MPKYENINTDTTLTFWTEDGDSALTFYVDEDYPGEIGVLISDGDDYDAINMYPHEIATLKKWLENK